jgi:hypothetical protein
MADKSDIGRVSSYFSNLQPARYGNVGAFIAALSPCQALYVNEKNGAEGVAPPLAPEQLSLAPSPSLPEYGLQGSSDLAQTLPRSLDSVLDSALLLDARPARGIPRLRACNFELLLCLQDCEPLL